MSEFNLEGLEEQANSAPTGSQNEPVAAEDEMFHCIYISGNSRIDESTGVTIIPEKLQIRGFQNNLSEVYMIITNYKHVRVKEESDGKGGSKPTCFSYEKSFPYRGTSGNVCPKNSAEREKVPFCKPCRSHYIVAGVLTDENGTPIKNPNKDNSLVFVFLKGKGMKYGNVSDYLTELYKAEFQPLILSDPAEKEKEKKLINNKRVITKITITEQMSQRFGKKKVFKLERSKELPIDTVKKLVHLSIKLVPEFNKKFDWSIGGLSSGKSYSEDDGDQYQSQQSNQNESTLPWDDGDSGEVSEQSNDQSNDQSGDFGDFTVF